MVSDARSLSRCSLLSSWFPSLSSSLICWHVVPFSFSFLPFPLSSPVPFLAPLPLSPAHATLSPSLLPLLPFSLLLWCCAYARSLRAASRLLLPCPLSPAVRPSPSSFPSLPSPSAPVSPSVILLPGTPMRLFCCAFVLLLCAPWCAFQGCKSPNGASTRKIPLPDE